ncbi:MAG: sugar phosphate isomerase/epimerase [Anaerolineae bacterium]|nr:MAG: sugar phosphate isomerase/epimerase [Anaerolineae bacterium]
MMVKIAFSSGSLYTFGLDRVFGLAGEAGFDGVEIMVDNRLDTRDATYLRHLEERHGLPILSLHSPFPLIPVDGWAWDDAARTQRTVALAQALGVPTVVTHLPLRFHVGVLHATLLQGRLLLPMPWRWGQSYARWLTTDLPALEQASSVTVAVENMPCHFLGKRRLDVHRMNRIEEWAQLRHLTLDTTHLGTWGLDILDVYEQVADRVAHVHLSNFRDGYEHLRLDDGHLPLGAFLERLRGRFQGTVAVELNPASLEAEDEGKVRAHLRATVEFCRQYTKVHHFQDTLSG